MKNWKQNIALENWENTDLYHFPRKLPRALLKLDKKEG